MAYIKQKQVRKKIKIQPLSTTTESGTNQHKRKDKLYEKKITKRITDNFNTNNGS